MAHQPSDERLWDRCLFCQSSDVTNLRDPYKDKTFLKLNLDCDPPVFKELSQRIIDLNNMNELPSTVLDLNTITDTNTNIDVDHFAQILTTNHAIWHKKMFCSG